MPFIIFFTGPTITMPCGFSPVSQQNISTYRMSQ
jgi:hypothetical protein